MKAILLLLEVLALVCIGRVVEKSNIHLGKTFSIKCCYIKSKNRHDSGLSDLFTSESAQHLINNILILDPIIFNHGCHSF